MEEQESNNQSDKSEGSTFQKAALNTATTIAKVMALFLAGFSFQAGLSEAFKLSYDASKSLSAARDYSQPRESSSRGFFGLGSQPAPPSENPIIGRGDPHLSQSFYHAGFQALRDAFEKFAEETKRVPIVGKE